ncbi:thiamine pyrophosphate-binding protein [Actinoplanes sp. NPDC048796]|uniref:thiamine pyrophosphate-binding protein n=1 Tax=unclassified Actinoplanes TaxID=2626549 RepID=UPI003405B7F2
MTVTVSRDCASALSDSLSHQGFAPFFGTPCGILAPLFQRLEDRSQLVPIAREDNAVGIAAGASMAGHSPVVMMQNSGLGQSVNALASLVVPYGVPMLLIVSMRGVPPDDTSENVVMGRITESVLAGAGIPVSWLDAGDVDEQVAWARSLVVERRVPAALLVAPGLFGWRP